MVCAYELGIMHGRVCVCTDVSIHGKDVNIQGKGASSVRTLASNVMYMIYIIIPRPSNRLRTHTHTHTHTHIRHTHTYHAHPQVKPLSHLMRNVARTTSTGFPAPPSLPPPPFLNNEHDITSASIQHTHTPGPLPHTLNTPSIIPPPPSQPAYIDIVEASAGLVGDATAHQLTAPVGAKIVVSRREPTGWGFGNVISPVSGELEHPGGWFMLSAVRQLDRQGVRVEVTDITIGSDASSETLEMSSVSLAVCACMYMYACMCVCMYI
jgi:hypothetical protein